MVAVDLVVESADCLVISTARLVPSGYLRVLGGERRLRD